MAAPLGKAMTHELAEQILVGHFDPAKNHRHSWLVAAGSNPAYEQFALQCPWLAHDSEPVCCWFTVYSENDLGPSSFHLEFAWTIISRASFSFFFPSLRPPAVFGFRQVPALV